MLFDFISADKTGGKPGYMQIYISVRQAIEDGSLKKGTRLPSIRRLCGELGVSKTMVIAAYDQLCAEGYINSVPQKGFFVAAEIGNMPQKRELAKENAAEKAEFREFDFSGKSIDSKIVDFMHWRRCVKDVINRDYLLTSYGDPQGEEALRLALQKYALGIRGVNSRAENIVVGAGTQPLLCLLCAALGTEKSVAAAEGSFVQSEFVLGSFGYSINYFESDRSGVSIDSLEKIKPDIVVVNPNFTAESGESIPVTRRLELIDWAKKNNALIIEDDYNGELRYSTHPMPCIQHYDIENTVYIGSFSKVLLPSVRLSYMVLPEKLMEKYREVKRLTNQTASKTEQLALARYIESGKIDIHLRKARRTYLEKSKIMLESLERHLPECRVVFNETSMYCELTPPSPVSTEKLEAALKKYSVRLMPQSRDGRLRLSFSGIAGEKIDEGIKALALAVHSSL